MGRFAGGRSGRKVQSSLQIKDVVEKTGAFVIVLLVVALDILDFTLGTIIEAVLVTLSIGCVGVITYLGVLTSSNYFARDPGLVSLLVEHGNFQVWVSD